MVWALPATMLRPYKRFEDHLNTIFIPCVLETPKTIKIAFSAYSLLGCCKGHAPYNSGKKKKKKTKKKGEGKRQREKD